MHRGRSSVHFQIFMGCLLQTPLLTNVYLFNENILINEYITDTNVAMNNTNSQYPVALIANVTAST